MRRESCPWSAENQGAFKRLNPNTSTFSSGNVTLTRLPLRRRQDLVWLRRETRTAAEQCGLDDHSVQSLCAASYEAARLLFAEGQNAGAEITVTEAGELQISIHTGLSAAVDRQAVGRSVCALATVLHRVSVQDSADSLLVTLSARMPLDGTRDVGGLRPVTTVETDGTAPAEQELVEENVSLRRALIELQDELTETNRGVVAFYSELDNQAERLRQAQEHLRILLDSVHDYAICSLDVRGDVVSWNHGAERVFGYPADAIIGRNISVFYPPTEREANLPTEHLRIASDEGRFECDSLRVRQDGSTFDALVLLMPMRAADGSPRGFSLVVQDITERKRREDDLRTRAEDLAAANRAREDFLATLSHELRTPLNAMLGWTRLLRMGKLDEAGKARALETIERNAYGQEKLIAEILDVSRIVTGRLRLNLRPIDLTPVLDAAIETLQPSAAAKGVELSSAMRRTGTVLGDPDRLQQVVWNLLSNAIKFTPAGGRVSVTVERVGGSALITVTDTGEGIPTSLLPFVFDRFMQGDASVTRAHGGLGLGLSIVRHLVELHGGHASARSDGPGQGSMFLVSLPLRTMPVGDADPEPSLRVESNSQAAAD
jgi:PAS domain S-box-containing protein